MYDDLAETKRKSYILQVLVAVNIVIRLREDSTCKNYTRKSRI